MQAKDIRNKIAAGQIKQAIEEFLTLSESALAQGSEWRNELYVLKGRLEEINKQERQGTMDEAEIIRLKNQISVAVMELTESWEQGVAPGTSSALRAKDKAPSRSGLQKWLPFVAALIVIVIGSIIFNQNFNKQKTQITRPNIERTTPSTTPDPVRIQEEEFTGCYIETDMLTYLLHTPEVGATRIGTLPQFKKYQVAEVRKVNFGNIRIIHFFKIKDNDLGDGWVKESIHVNYISPDCL